MVGAFLTGVAFLAVLPFLAGVAFSVDRPRVFLAGRARVLSTGDSVEPTDVDDLDAVVRFAGVPLGAAVFLAAVFFTVGFGVGASGAGSSSPGFMLIGDTWNSLSATARPSGCERCADAQFAGSRPLLFRAAGFEVGWGGC